MKTKRLFIESRNSFELLQRAFTLSRMSHNGIKSELSLKLKAVRQYLSNYRGGAFDYLSNYPCGYQDSHGDKVDRLFFEYESLKLAYKLSKGEATAVMHHFQVMVGDHDHQI